MICSRRSNNFLIFSKNCITYLYKYRNKSYTSLDYCINLVRQLDNENYYCTLLLPQQIRTSAFAIRALNVEVAGIQDQVTQANIGLMRMKFWEETIHKIHNGKFVNNPVAVELGKAMSKHKLSQTHLLNLISSRSKRLGQVSFLSVKEMEDYAEESCSSVFLLLLQVMGINSIQCNHAAVHLGKAQGLSNLLRGIPHNLSKRTIPLPSDLLALHNLSEESILRGNITDCFAEVIFHISENAHLHLLRAQEQMKDIPLDVRKIFLPAVSVNRYLHQLKNVHFNVFDGGIQKKNPLLPLILFWHSFTRTY